MNVTNFFKEDFQVCKISLDKYKIFANDYNKT